MRLRFDPSVQQALESAKEEAYRLGHNHLAPPHLVLGLIASGTVDRLLSDLHVDRGRLVQVLEDALPVRRRGSRRGSRLPYTSWAKKAVELAMAEAKADGPDVRPPHLLLGALQCPGGLEERTAPVGLTQDRVRAAASGRPVPPLETREASLPWFVEVDSESEVPLFEQIVSKVEEAVATGRLVRGERLPSVRDLAGELGIAPGTVARAYSDLESRGVVVTEGARGTRISAEPRGLEDAEDRVATLEGLLRPLVITAHHLGASGEEVRDALERAMRRVDRLRTDPA